MLNITNDDLPFVLTGLESERDRITVKIAEIRQMLGVGRTESASSTETAKPRKKRSAAVRRKMALAQRARYAKLKQGSEPRQVETAKPKRKLSAAGRKAIIEATKRRWALVRAAKKAAAKAPKKTVKKAVARKSKSAVNAPEQTVQAAAQ